MKEFDTDLHIHSPYSIAVSKNMLLDNILVTSKKKGINILGTGDVTQPDWRKYLETNLEYKNGVYSYKGMNYIIQTELEDEDSVHHVVLLPNLKAGEVLQQKLDGKAKGLDSAWGGRPHVHMGPAEVADLIDEIGGISGPAHAFTPFKAIFRQKKYKNLEEAYGSSAKKIYFLELGLSADTDLADRMACLKDITFLSNSDAHSESAVSLGREFNRMDLDSPSYDEVVKAIRRQDGRKITLNVGLEPKLGKYPMIFCKACRKRFQLYLESKLPDYVKSLPITKGLAESYAVDDAFIYYIFKSQAEIDSFKEKIGQEKIQCLSCLKAKQNGVKGAKSSKIYLGVFDRIGQIGDYAEPKHPSHRPPYFDSIPLLEMIRAIKGVKSANAVSVTKEYDTLINKFGPEFKILTDTNVQDQLRKEGQAKLADLIIAFRDHKIDITPGGGGHYGEIQLGDFE